MEREIRLIDANERMKWLENNTTQEDWLVNQYNADWIYSMLESAPTVDAVEVVHGRWDKNWSGDNIVYCDQCYMPQDVPTHYCPSCGAKMDGGAKQ